VTGQQILSDAREWLTLGVCPGCGCDLELVAGEADGHYRDGRLWYGGVGATNDRCPVSADELSALVHIGSGVVTVR
jgi:hypothetical protein